MENAVVITFGFGSILIYTNLYLEADSWTSAIPNHCGFPSNMNECPYSATGATSSTMTRKTVRHGSTVVAP
ncbi:hypothetical protein CFP56_011483 [Quercus suber]|uniref:Uncharacterized protein n=1 Tax=Quercus suber TaxID=58331 RepID=A0AAW0M5T5_QUESU